MCIKGMRSTKPDKENMHIDFDGNTFTEYIP